ncbi:proline reductase-associated electron transfer protein PrdC [Natranaerobius trueperi]|uniref:Proline reductase-associated electron transfer protein PrdC n=1 Tax=Natranaerobius trueperi TaxID=759412 RepID=A0A226BZV6_9FIRM|nr:proline reductase-associated electron transfer protein PrdC [Natranaerobius trueperi]OWZ84332.1 proline reductase-associated electron transfer protein PrdC [Natranaerobius trueperi]
MVLKIALTDHIGKPAQAVVEVGQKVIKGQVIGKTEGDAIGSIYHSPINGKVNDITKDVVVIEPEDEKSNVLKLDDQDELSLIKSAGVVGAGGAGFPTYKKLDVDLEGKGIVLANGVECEPYLLHNKERMKKNPEDIISGLKTTISITNAKKAYIVVKEKEQEIITLLNEKVSDEPTIEIKTVKDIYPMGEERAIIREVLGELLEPDQLPLEANSVVLNIETLLNVKRAVIDKTPVISKDLTLVGRIGEERTQKVLLDVPIGTKVKDLVEDNGGLPYQIGEIIMGGPFTGNQVDLKTPINKATGGIFATLPLPNRENMKIGLLECGCGAQEDRLRQIAEEMGAEVVGIEKCKQAVEMKNGQLKCTDPGNCPGQAEKILNLKKNKAQAVIVGTCSDCSNTVMGVAPKLKLGVFHSTDHVNRTMGDNLVRFLDN